MMVHRRRVLAAGAGFAALAIGEAGAMAASPGREAEPVTLLLYSEGLQGSAWAAQLRRDAARPNGIPGRSSEHVVALQRHDGFRAVGTLLEQAGRCRLFALLNDADALVIDRLLGRQATEGRRMHAAPDTAAIAPMLLTAML